MVTARQDRWGIVQVENEVHCNFVKLREMLLCTNLEDVREQRHLCCSELYQHCKLGAVGFASVGPNMQLLRLQET